MKVDEIKINNIAQSLFLYTGWSSLVNQFIRKISCSSVLSGNFIFSDFRCIL